jgi:hypothetical protein
MVMNLKLNLTMFKRTGNSYLYIKAAKSFFNVPREKLSPRPLAAEAEQSRGFDCTKMTFTLTAVVESNAPEFRFRGLFR